MRRHPGRGARRHQQPRRERAELHRLARTRRVALGAEPPGALWRPSPNFWRGRDGWAVDGIVVHGTAGGDGPAAVALLCDPVREASTHFVIGQDGAVFQLVRLRDSAWGNGIPVHPSWRPVVERDGVNPNRYTVSIEHAKRSVDNSDAPTSEQLSASVRLVRWLLAALPAMGLAGGHLRACLGAGELGDAVVGHCRIDSVTRAHCPGTWDWERYLGLVAGQNAVG